MRLGLTRRDENRGQAGASTRKQRLGRRSLAPIFERVWQRACGALHGSRNFEISGVAGGQFGYRLRISQRRRNSRQSPNCRHRVRARRGSFWRALSTRRGQQKHRHECLCHTHVAQCGKPQTRKIKRQKAKIKRQKSLSRASGRIGEESSGAGRNQNNRQ